MNSQPAHLLAPSPPGLGTRLPLLDAHDRLLLIHVHDPTDPEPGWWGLQGGGLVNGEDSTGAHRRELAEETGLTDAEIGPVRWQPESGCRYIGDHGRLDPGVVGQPVLVQPSAGTGAGGPCGLHRRIHDQTGAL